MGGLDERSRGSYVGEARMNLRLPVLLCSYTWLSPKLWRFLLRITSRPRSAGVFITSSGIPQYATPSKFL